MPPGAMQKDSHYNEKLDNSLVVLALEVATQQPPDVNLVGVTPEIHVMEGTSPNWRRTTLLSR